MILLPTFHAIEEPSVSLLELEDGAGDNSCSEIESANDRLACGNGGDRSSIVRIVDSVLLLMLLSLTSVDDSSWQIYVFVRAQRT